MVSARSHDKLSGSVALVWLLRRNTFLAWQLLQAWCWLDRAEMGSEARLSSWTLLVSGSYLKVLNMAIEW